MTASPSFLGRRRPPGLIGLACAAIELWALLGGGLLIAIVLLTAYSAAANLLLGSPVPGDFEIAEVGVALAAFAFLPYCQLTRANVTADVFTLWAGARTQAALAFVASLVALAFSLVLLWRMSEGLADYREYVEVTPIIGFPIWIAFLPILVSLALLLLASVLTALQDLRALRSVIPTDIN